MTSNGRSGYGGVAWVLLYVLFTAVQGVWLGSFLQRVDFFATVFVYFALTMIFFLALFVLRGKSIVSLVRACGVRDIVILNILTCASWLSYFAAIKYIEPAVEAAIGSAVPVITTLIILYAQGNRNFNRHNLISAAVIFLGGSILVYASLAGMSAIGAQETSRIVVGVLMAVITGVAIAAYMLFSKKLYRKKNHGAGNHGAAFSVVVDRKRRLGALGSHCSDRPIELANRAAHYRGRCHSAYLLPATRN